MYTSEVKDSTLQLVLSLSATLPPPAEVKILHGCVKVLRDTWMTVQI